MSPPALGWPRDIRLRTRRASVAAPDRAALWQAIVSAIAKAKRLDTLITRSHCKPRMGAPVHPGDSIA
jgi:hypothetical protein